ncbi:MAG: hypothetical protein ABR863_00975 [Roseiarcus sp.]
MNSNPRRHLVITGTGRAGTTFLVRYFDALGVETQIAKSGDAQWSAAANAGLEDTLYASPIDALPYVVKSPWIAEFVEQLVADDRIAIDAFVIPVRDLRNAAASRIILELRNMYETADWMASYEETWRHWGVTPGGAVFSLDPIDQERILATGFARLVQSAVRADIPIVFLDFPRMIADADYLYAKLRPYLPANLDVEIARERHRRVADLDKVRVEGERSALRQPHASDGGSPPLASADSARRGIFEQLDLVALRREIARRKQELGDLADARQKIADLKGRNSAARRIITRALRSFLDRVRTSRLRRQRL